ncbi:unnamed protein product [Pleuronectes platessa]|uniref:PDZ domain-containing protein n=1 Tax=Pleuronectes platessa TaxID=8262 RepID=A0A9N7ZCI0_PLEPL|nr:unnamed protein product [Pleuronectes platessa]
MFEDSVSEKSKETEASVKSLPQQNVDSYIWVPDYLAPSWVCLPNDQPVLAIIQPGDTALEVLSTICKTHKIDRSSHYLRLKVWVDNKMLFCVPQLEDDISDLVYKEIEICPKTTKMIRFDNAESFTIGYGFSVAVIDEDGTQQLHITEVKEGGLASAKGLQAGDEILLLNGKPASALQMDDMRAAFVNQALTLCVSTLPQLDPRVLRSVPPRRSDGEQDPTTDIFSQSQEDILDEVSGLTVESSDMSLEEGPQPTLQSPGDNQEDKTGAGQKRAQQCEPVGPRTRTDVSRAHTGCVSAPEHRDDRETGREQKTREGEGTVLIVPRMCVSELRSEGEFPPDFLSLFTPPPPPPLTTNPLLFISINNMRLLLVLKQLRSPVVCEA